MFIHALHGGLAINKYTASRIECFVPLLSLFHFHAYSTYTADSMLLHTHLYLPFIPHGVPHNASNIASKAGLIRKYQTGKNRQFLNKNVRKNPGLSEIRRFSGITFQINIKLKIMSNENIFHLKRKM